MELCGNLLLTSYKEEIETAEAYILTDESRVEYSVNIYCYDYVLG